MRSSTHDPRRRLLLTAGSSLLLSPMILRRARAADEVTITMSGSATGSHVWFRPRGLLIRPGQTVRWINSDAGNVHTVTAYHPDNQKPRRIPAHAPSWDSAYLMPDAAFLMTFEVPGVYDYFCIPHERAGMVGRIVVGNVDRSVRPYQDTDTLLPENALSGFPAVDTIIENISVE